MTEIRQDDMPESALAHVRDDALMTADLCLGGRSGTVKRIHHATCRHARLPYPWARQFPSIEALVDELWTGGSGAWRWHRFCAYCCPEFVDYERKTYLGEL